MPKCWTVSSIWVCCLWAFLGASGPAARADQMLSWSECLRLARERHPDIRAAIESVRAAESELKSSRSAYLPDLDGTVDYSRPHSSPSGDAYSIGLSGSQRLFPGLTDRPEVEQARARLDAARADLAEVASSVRFDLQSTFANLLYAQESLALAEKIEERRRRNVDLVTARFDAGREHQGSQLRARAQADESAFDVRQARRSIRVAQQELLRILGRADFEPVRVAGTFFYDTQPAEPDIQTLAGGTPAVLRVAADRRAAELGVTLSRREFYPTLSLSGSAARTDGRWPPRSTTGGWSGGLSLSVPLFSGGRERHDVLSAQSDFKRLEFVERSARDFAVFDLEDRRAALADALERVGIRASFLEAGRLRAEIAQAQYTTGLLSYQDWDIIENDFISQEKLMLAAKRDALIAEAAWNKSAGKGFEP